MSSMTTGQMRAVTGGHGRGPRGRLSTLGSGINFCPIPDCGWPIDPSRLMCRFHWYGVPKHVRDRVWATWRSGQGAFSAEHQDAVRVAIAAVPCRQDLPVEPIEQVASSPDPSG
jgi:hypothetical protein